MKAGNTNIATGQNPIKEERKFTLLSHAITGTMKTGLSGIMFLFLLSTCRINNEIKTTRLPNTLKSERL